MMNPLASCAWRLALGCAAASLATAALADTDDLYVATTSGELLFVDRDTLANRAAATVPDGIRGLAPLTAGGVAVWENTGVGLIRLYSRTLGTTGVVGAPHMDFSPGINAFAVTPTASGDYLSVNFGTSIQTRPVANLGSVHHFWGGFGTQVALRGFPSGRMLSLKNDFDTVSWSISPWGFFESMQKVDGGQRITNLAGGVYMVYGTRGTNGFVQIYRDRKWNGGGVEPNGTFLEFWQLSNATFPAAAVIEPIAADNLNRSISVVGVGNLVRVHSHRRFVGSTEGFRFERNVPIPGPVSAMAALKDGNLAVGTSDGGLHIVDPRAGVILISRTGLAPIAHLEADPSAEAITVAGRVTLEDHGLGDANTVPVTLEIRQPGGAVVETKTLTLAADGAFSFTTTLKGTYDLAFKASHWLRKTVADVDLAAVSPDVSLPNGDIDGDNSVTVFDYDGLSTAFDSSAGDASWNPEADLDGDGAVTVFDYDILSNNFDRVGDD